MSPDEIREIRELLEEQRRLCLAEAESKRGERDTWLEQAQSFARLLEKYGCPKPPGAG